MKPRIFIGSSTEGLAVAQRIKTFFEPEYDCYIWNDGIFQFNLSSTYKCNFLGADNKQ